MKLNIDKIYALHHPSYALRERKCKLENFFASNGVKVEWVEGFSPEESKKRDRSLLIKAILEKGPEKCRGNIEASDAFSLKLASLILKHNYCYEDQVKNNYENVLILEDDVDLFSNFSEDYFNKCMEEFKEKGLEMLFMGSCCGLHYFPTNPNQYVYPHESLRTRCSHCYIVNIEASRRLLKHCYKMFDAADWQLNWMIEEEKIKNSWAEPSIHQLDYESTLDSADAHHKTSR